jgi:azurin
VTLLLAACGSESGDKTASAQPEPTPPSPAATREDSPVSKNETPAEATPQNEITSPTPAYAADRETAQTNIDAPAPAETPAPDSGDPCTLSVAVGDDIAYSVTELRIPASCAEVTVELTHTGRLPAAAMGHNWVLVPADALQPIAQAGIGAGLENGYVPDDDRIVAATRLIGGGEKDSVTFSLGDLQDGVEYRYVCTVPGHWMVMQGSFEVVPGS